MNAQELNAKHGFYRFGYSYVIAKIDILLKQNRCMEVLLEDVTGEQSGIETLDDLDLIAVALERLLANTADQLRDAAIVQSRAKAVLALNEDAPF